MGRIFWTLPTNPTFFEHSANVIKKDLNEKDH